MHRAFLLFCVIMLLHVSTLSCHLQGASIRTSPSYTSNTCVTRRSVITCKLIVIVLLLVIVQKHLLSIYKVNNYKSTNCMLLILSVPGGLRRYVVRNCGTREK